MRAAAASLNNKDNPAGGFANNPVLAQIYPVLQAHKFASNMTEEAYGIFSPDSNNVYAVANRTCVTVLLKIFQSRVDLHKTGVPQDPAIDRRAAGYLISQTGLWPILNPAEQSQVMNLIADLCDYAAAEMSTKEGGEMASQLFELRTQLCGSVIVVSAANNNTPLKDAATRAKGLSANTPAASVVQVVGQMTAQIRKDYPKK